MADVYLLANDIPGNEVAKYLVANGDNIKRLYIHSPDYQKQTKEIIASSGCSEEEIYYDIDLKDTEHVKELRADPPEFIITVYWRHLLSMDVINAATKSTVNFHPALLPVNRGWYPHVHSIIDKSPAGVTLHVLEEGADTGPIWAQRKIEVLDTDTAKTVYDRSQREIVNLFRKMWPDIVAGKITPTPQEHSKAVYHKKKEVNKFDRLDLDKKMTVAELLDLLRARSFGNLGFAHFERAGKKVYVNLRLGESMRFDNE